MIINKYFSCHYVEILKANLLFKLELKVFNPSCITQANLMYCACLFLHIKGSVWLANLGGTCLHNGGSWRQGVSFLGVAVHDVLRARRASG